jgi:dsDNA-specific endonuclease/ATPase MutS2
MTILAESLLQAAEHVPGVRVGRDGSDATFTVGMRTIAALDLSRDALRVPTPDDVVPDLLAAFDDLVPVAGGVELLIRDSGTLDAARAILRRRAAVERASYQYRDASP